MGKYAFANLSETAQVASRGMFWGPLMWALLLVWLVVAVFHGDVGAERRGVFRV